VSESVLSLATQLSKLLLLEFEALKVQDLDRFESLQPGKNDLLAGLAKLCPSAEDLQNLPEHKELRELLIESRDLHRRNAVLIERKLDTIRGTLHSLHTGETGSPVEVYDRLGQVARYSKGRGYQEI
jgi:flagellar biosynthesis/type III secretory pathway chaperone